MAKKILIIDDDSGSCHVMGELSTAIGVEPTLITKPGEAVEALERLRPDLVVLDLLLPGTDAFVLGEKMRAAPGGRTVPILAVSGVLKQNSVTKDLKTRLDADFLPKPFDAITFQTRVAQALGIPLPASASPAAPAAAPSQGHTPSPAAQQIRSFTCELRQTPAYTLLYRLSTGHATGHLEVTRGQVRRRVSFQGGTIRFAQSNLAQENIGGMQVAAGTLSQADLQAAMQQAQQGRRPLGDTLVSLGKLSGAQLVQGLADQTRAVASGLLAWTDGQASFRPDDPQLINRLPDCRLAPLAAIYEGIQRAYPPATLRQLMGQRGQAYPQRGDALQRESFTLKKVAADQRILGQINGARSLAELAQGATDAELPLLFTVIGTGICALSDKALVRAKPQAPEEQGGGATATGHALVLQGARDDAALDAGQEFSPQEQEARREIAAEFARHAEATHYEVLGVSASADGAAIQKAYLELARRWHTDRFSGLKLGSAQPKLESVFSRVGEARTILANEGQRGEYDVYLDRKAKGLPTDVNAILRAEDLFLQAEKLVDARKGAEALAALEEAITLNHAEPEYYAYRGYARFLVEGDDGREAALDDLSRALEGKADMASAHYFIGMIAFAGGDLRGAMASMRKVLAAQPGHVKAQQQIRVIERQGGGDAGKKEGGLFGKIFK